MLGSKGREISRLQSREGGLLDLLQRTQEALGGLRERLAEEPDAPTRGQLEELLGVWRRVVVDHIATGVQHPDPAVRTQARSLMTELDCAGLNIDADVRAALSGAP